MQFIAPGLIARRTTFQPSLTFGGAAVGMTYSVQTGSITRIGKTSFVSGRISLSAKGSSTGIAAISLPDALLNLTDLALDIPLVTVPGVGGYALFGELNANSASMTLYRQLLSSGAVSYATEADFTNSQLFTFNFSYPTN